ncbi:putative gustatory receptor 2a [Teleopsis dalmanni]|uniref:putative gustatory receptor 2a n=1 Tax=Teleopsis dalmanni TaxID=139649 RepID=UPI0018CC850E|nr:putative gustatory receptor 2a [Teleopsis dalmanni]
MSVAVIVIGFIYRGSYVNFIGSTETKVFIIQSNGIRFAHLISIIETIVRRIDQKTFYEDVREIDLIFQCSLNVNIDNGKFRQEIISRGLIMFLIYLLSVAAFLMPKFIEMDGVLAIYWILYALPLFVCGLRYFQIFCAITIIKRRFEQLNTVLGEVNLQRALPIYEINERINRIYEMENPELKRLLIIREIYNRLWEITTIFNRAVGVSLLINLGNDFISLTSSFYWIFLNLKSFAADSSNLLTIVANTIWTFPHIFNILVLAVICQSTVQTTINIALALHHTKSDILNDNYNTVIEQFSLQLLHQKFAFSAAGFFNVDCTLLYTIVGAITTYLIILIQFDMYQPPSSTD